MVWLFITTFLNIKSTDSLYYVGYLCTYFDAAKKNEIACKDFLIQFNTMGKERRDDKHRAQLRKQRDALKRQKV